MSIDYVSNATSPRKEEDREERSNDYAYNQEKSIEEALEEPRHHCKKDKVYSWRKVAQGGMSIDYDHNTLF
jgi:hypothetical protein